MAKPSKRLDKYRFKKHERFSDRLLNSISEGRRINIEGETDLRKMKAVMAAWPWM